MKLGRAILSGALLWVLIFFEVSILMFGLKLTAGTLYYAIHYALAFFLIAIASLIYFKKARKGFSQGLIVGLIFVVVGVILDAIITVPLFIVQNGLYAEAYKSFFLGKFMILGYLETIIVAGIFGAVKKR